MEKKDRWNLLGKPKQGEFLLLSFFLSCLYYQRPIEANEQPIWIENREDSIFSSSPRTSGHGFTAARVAMGGQPGRLWPRVEEREKGELRSLFWERKEEKKTLLSLL